MKRILLVFICIISITNTLQAQTIYTYTGTGDWTDTANWSPSYPGLFIPNGDTAIISEGSQATVPNGSGGISIEGRIDIDGTLIINTTSSFSTISPLFNIRINSTGTLQNNSTIFNDGNFINSGMLINNGFINNDRLFSSGGSGDFNNQNVIRNRTGGEMNLSSSSPFVNMNSGIFNDFGGQLTLLGFNLTGNFSNSGSITFFNAGLLGTLTNTDTGTIANPDSNFTILSGGTIINDGTINSIRNFSISNGGTLTNSGFLNINNFTFAINSGGILTNSSTGTITNNATFINNSDLTNNGSLINNNVYTNNGFLRGTNIAHTSDFVNAAIGDVSPGGILPENLIGTYTFNDNFILQSSEFFPTLFIDINGNTQAGIDYDRVNVTGDITLAGRLLVQLPFGYTPQIGDEYTILTGANLSGTFDQTSLPSLAIGLIWEVNYNPTNVVLTVLAGCEVPVTFTAPAAICLNAGVQTNLSGGLSEGGAYSGPGVTDDGNGMTYSFDPQTAGVGIHVITYTFIDGVGCSDSASDTIEVFDLPMITFVSPAPICIDAGVQTGLGGATPSGGVYSGPGVTDDGNGMTYSFDPQTAGVGIHVITYTFIDGVGCSDSASDTIEVFDLPMITFVSPAPICIDAGVQTGLGGATPSGGVYSGPGVTDDGNGMTYSFDPAATGLGTYTITYEVTDTNGCTNNAAESIEVVPLPAVSFTAPPNLAVDAGIQMGLSGGTPTVSIASTTVTLNVSYDVAGFSGFIGGNIIFDGSGAMLSTDVTANNEASGSTVNLVNAAALGDTITLTFDNGQTPNIVADTAIIGASGTINFISGTDFTVGGDLLDFLSGTGTATTDFVGSRLYTGSGVTMDANGTTYSFDPAVAGLGTHTIAFTFTDDNGCAATASDTIEVFTEMSEFITTWKTDNPGTSNDNQITIPAIGGNYTVDWGDMSTPDTNVSGAITHTYPTTGTYTVTISGTFPTIFFNNGGDREKILTVENWGNPVWNSMARAFHGCTNLVINAPDSPDLSQVTSMAGMFDGATAINQDIGDWDVSNVQNLNGMFRNTSFNQDISNWDVSNVSVFAFMFDGATAFNQDLSAWGTRLGSADDMASMFRGATAFNGAIENWDVTTVTNMVGVFEGTAFNRDINTWNVSNVSNMAFMFSDATAFNQPLDQWATRLGNVTDMTNMFEGATAFNQDISGWNVSNVQLMAGMFSGATSFNMPIGGWGATTASVVNMEFMFNEATSFDQNISSWNVESVSNMTAMFFGVTLSSDNYDSLLTGWSTQTLQNDVEFDAGNSGYCTAEAARQSIIDNFNWDIIDIGTENIPPVISDCPTDIMVPEPTNPTDCGAIATFTTPTATDNCSTATVTQVAGLASGEFFPSGTTVVTFEAVDAAGNVATCSFNVIVANSTPPVAVCQPFTLQLDANGMATLNPEDINGGSTDDCNSINLSVSRTTFGCADVGTPQMVTLTVDDGSGNIDTCTAMVTVEDNIAPTINCQDLTVDLDMSGTITLDPATVLADLATFEVVLVSGNNDSNLPGSSDITVPITEDVTITFDWTYATDDGAEFDPFGYLLNGVFTELTDIAGDEFNQSGTEAVMLSNGDTFGFRAFTLDNTFGPATTTITNFQPSFQGQFATANWTETLTESDGSAVINENLAVFDACGIASITMDQTTFTTADIGSNPVMYTVTDIHGNVNTCNAFVNVFSAGTSCPTTTTYTTAGGWDNGTPNATTRAIIAEDYNTSTVGLGDITACELIINSGATLTVADGNSVSVENNIIINGTLDVANTGSVVQIDENAVTINNGSIAVAKTTPTLDDRNFVAMSSPVTAEARDRVYGNSRAVFSIIPSNFVPFDIDFVEFPEFEFAENFLDDNNDYLLPVTGSTTTPAAGIGQLIFPQPEPNVGDGSYTLTYTQSPMNPGTLNSGTISVPINYNGPATTNNYNLLGNPYASAIDVTAFINANDAVNEVYYWDHISMPSSDLPGFGTSNFSMNDISIRNAMMGIAAVNGGTPPGQFMASGQGFGIKADQAEMVAGTPIVFTNSIRVTGNNDGFRNAETSTDIDKLWLNLTTTAFDEAIAQTGIGFTSDATPSIDKGYDSPRVGTFLSLFTSLASGELLGIQSREAFDTEMEIALGFSTSIEEITPYTISIGNLEGIAIGNASVFIIDHLLNTIVNLNEQSYTFTAQKGIYADRFTMVFQDREVLSADGDSFRESVITLYPNPSQGQVTLAYSGTSTLENAVITDINGKIIKRIDLTNFNQTQTMDLGDLARGMYFMQIISQGNTVTKKLILR
ncbi:BspA family leucine-rich repeat surface protein [uncultured Dokdonia sp.]|uniref:BspA family leucine-rich repeat surface protein n=1 Tax=uncultured Dokdonia sp. TaxID=575653 RepID=UPI0026034175|nr:BspA family leucine-rich repeat surface protein [uncultured Dokdonia sp.]